VTCCSTPDVHQDAAHRSASCGTCGFRWTFGQQGKGKFKSKREKWGPAWYCEDNYDRSWRTRDYDRHEVVGTRRRGNREDYVVGCPHSGNTIAVSADSPPDEVYCEDCDRTGLLGPMVKRYQIRKEEAE
jgi:hypothetical protein